MDGWQIHAAYLTLAVCSSFTFYVVGRKGRDVAVYNRGFDDGTAIAKQEASRKALLLHEEINAFESAHSQMFRAITPIRS